MVILATLRSFAHLCSNSLTLLLLSKSTLPYIILFLDNRVSLSRTRLHGVPRLFISLMTRSPLSHVLRFYYHTINLCSFHLNEHIS